ncbi:MAG TPA: DUF2189 domain-containing protein [Alphaproteobacteria bacterium]
MAQQKLLADRDTDLALPKVRKIHLSDLRDALAKGFDDFWAMPSHVVFLSLIYPVLGLILARMVFGQDVLPLLFPMVAGFALIGPFAAIGLYELSRRRERGLETGWTQAFSVLRSPSFGPVLMMGALLLGIFVCWMYAAQTVYDMTFGDTGPVAMRQFLENVLTTPQGWVLIAVGNAVGFLFAAFVLAISVVSFPMLLDRPVGVSSAIATSVRATVTNPVVIAAWGLIVAAALVLGSLPALLGLAIVMPVLGHATWHLYRRIVE